MGTSITYGADSGIASLKWPAINFALLFGFILWKIRVPLKNYFMENHQATKQLYHLARERDKEAKIKLEMYQKKMDEVDVDCEKILEQGKASVESFSHNYRQELTHKKERFKTEEEQKIKQHQLQAQQKLKEILVSNIIAKVEEKIRSEGKLKGQVTKKLLSQLDGL